MESAPSSCLLRERSNQAICAGLVEEKKEKGRDGDQLHQHVLVDGDQVPFISSFIGRFLVTSPDARSSSFLIVSRISTTLGLFIDVLMAIRGAIYGTTVLNCPLAAEKPFHPCKGHPGFNFQPFLYGMESQPYTPLASISKVSRVP